ncbi:MAG: hypothetical protein ACFE9Z_16490 [Promethearchaeota archaeon]
MRKKSIGLIIAIFMVANISTIGLFFLPVIGYSTIEFPEYQPIDIGYEIRNSELPLVMGDLSIESSLNTLRTGATELDIGMVLPFASLDYFNGYYFLDLFELRAVGDNAEIWVQLDIGWDEGDPRPDPNITNAQCEYLADEFDTNIYPLVTDYFGMPEFHDGSNAIFPYFFDPPLPLDTYYDEPGKSIVLVSNIRDENYYDYTYPYFVIGVFSPTIEGWFDRNVVSLDAYNWENYLGGPGGQYEGTLAHEYQHLIHDDYQEVKTAFMNEGCSMFAEVLCGYPTAWNDINSFFATPDNSLINWGDQGGINILADYGQALLWATYLVDNYGADILKNYVQSGITGIEGIENQLPSGVSFNDVYQEWTLANLMREGYTHIDFNDEDAGELRIYEVEDKWPQGITGTSFGTTITILGYDTGIDTLGAYGTDYIMLSKLKKKVFSTLEFNGLDDKLYYPMWVEEDVDSDGELEWYTSDPGGYADISLVTEVDLALESSAELSFTTFYAIEEDADGGWDFGFVQVSTNGGDTWISLTNEYTTEDHNPNAQASIVAELPGLTGYVPDVFTMTFNLDDYLVDNLLIRFRYMTDEIFQDYGWWIEDVKVNGEPVPEFGPAFDNVDYYVHLIRVDYWRNRPYYTIIHKMELDENNEGSVWLVPFTYFRSPDLILAVSANIGGVDYEFSVNKNCFCYKWRPWM